MEMFVSFKIYNKKTNFIKIFTIVASFDCSRISLISNRITMDNVWNHCLEIAFYHFQKSALTR